MKYILLYNKLNIPLDIFDIIVYLNECGYSELVPREIFAQAKDNNTLFLVDNENKTHQVINGEERCIEFLSEQSLVIHLKDKACNYIKYLNEKKIQ